jgi:hypothetical protein
MRGRVTESIPIEIEHYRGSLDFECSFCHGNSYDNYHVSKNDELVLVFCLDCFNKIKEEK